MTGTDKDSSRADHGAGEKDTEVCFSIASKILRCPVYGELCCALILDQDAP